MPAAARCHRLGGGVEEEYCKKFSYTWQFSFVIDKRKCVTVNSWWRSRKTSYIPCRIFLERHQKTIM
jgi:hypothetical protein